MIRSVLLYGSTALVSASHTNMQLLERVQYTALQICAGTMRGTKYTDLIVHCGELPISLQITQNKLKCYINATYYNTAARSAVEEHWTCTYGHGKRVQTLLYNTTREFDKYCQDKNLKKVDRYAVPAEPPWLLPSINTDISLHGRVEKTINPTAAKAAADELIAANTADRVVYTDASLNQGKAGIGILITDRQKNIIEQHSIRLSDNISIYKAELHGILVALTKVLETGYNDNLIIYTDSLSCVQSIISRHSFTNSTTVETIYTQAAKFTRSPTITWVPSHVGIFGNEIVDKLANQATEKANIEYELYLTVEEARSSVNDYVFDLYQKWWDKETSKYKNIQPTVTNKPLYAADLRSQDVMITRLLLARCRLNAVLHKMNRHPTGLCDLCPVPETVQHFLTGCVTPLATLIRDAMPRSDTPMAELLLNRKIQEIIFKNTKRRL